MEVVEAVRIAAKKLAAEEAEAAQLKVAEETNAVRIAVEQFAAEEAEAARVNAEEDRLEHADVDTKFSRCATKGDDIDWCIFPMQMATITSTQQQTLIVTTPSNCCWDGSGTYKLYEANDDDIASAGASDDRPIRYTVSDGRPMWKRDVMIDGQLQAFLFRSPQRHTWCLATGMCMEEDDEEENAMESAEAGESLPTSCTYGDGAMVKEPERPVLPN